VRAYRYEQNGATIHDIDVVNMKRIINGVDRLAKIRAAIGL
jgi:P2 family phage contractile tail tube protein